MYWEPVDNQFLHGKLRGYKVRYKEHAQMNPVDWIVKTISRTIPQANVTDLKAGTVYELQVSAFTIKDGPWSESIFAETEKGSKFPFFLTFFEVS